MFIVFVGPLGNINRTKVHFSEWLFKIKKAFEMVMLELQIISFITVHCFVVQVGVLAI